MEPNEGQHAARNARPRHSIGRTIASVLLWALTAFLVVGMASRYAPSVLSNGRLIPEVAAFVPWFAIPSAAMLLVATFTRRKALSVLTALCLVCQVFWHVGFFLPASRIAPKAVEPVPVQTSADTVMRIMTLNTKNGLADADQIVSIVRDQRVEVLALQEVSASLIERLAAAGIDELLPSHVFGEPGPYDNGGVNVLYALAPMSDASSSILPIMGSAAPAATVTAGSHTVRLVSTHPTSPKSGTRGFWNESLRNLSSLRQYDDEYLIMGDFNSTWDHSRYRKMLGDTLVDASQQAGEGFHMTYPSEPDYAMFPVPPMIEIDHIVYSKNSGMSVGSLQTVNVSGTDHLALLGTWTVS
ncbi:MAG: hypothetical protein PEGG_01855 [Paraeggerthella hongkongensis]